MSSQQVRAKDEPVTTSTAESTKPSSLDTSIQTSIMILSDTHGMTLDGRAPSQVADVCIHAGDLTEQSLLEEFRTTIALLCRIKARLKLVIAGNHDFTLDTLSFQKKIQAIKPPLEPNLVKKFYGDYEEARKLLINAEEEYGIHLLDEGMHDFKLQNGAKLRVYASPYTPSLGDWGFQYHPNLGHHFAIEEGTNIVITHGPPRGILDRTDSRERAGCPDLFTAVAKVRPQIHCFGHIHEGWGAKMVAWRRTLSDKPSFLSDIDNTASYVIEQLSTLHETKFDTSDDVNNKKAKLEKYTKQKYCSASCSEKDAGKTLFVNGSIKGDSYEDLHLPWLVDVMLPQDAHLASVAENLIFADSASASGSGFGMEGATLPTQVRKKRALDCEHQSDTKLQRGLLVAAVGGGGSREMSPRT